MRRGHIERTLRAAAAVSAALLLVACGAKKETSDAPVVTVDVAPVLGSNIQQTVRADALLYPVQQAAIAPKITAPVSKIYAERGAHVRAGDVLLELESLDLAGAVRESQAAYDLAEATYETTARATVPEETQKAQLDLRAAKDALDAQQAIYNSRQSLFKEGAVAQKDVNEAQVDLGQARNRSNRANASRGPSGFRDRSGAQGRRGAARSGQGAPRSGASAARLRPDHKPDRWRRDGSSDLPGRDGAERHAGRDGDGPVARNRARARLAGRSRGASRRRRRESHWTGRRAGRRHGDGHQSRIGCREHDH